MGHYLSDFESDEQFRNRTVYSPMRERLDVYDQEVKRGIVHTAKWDEKMADYRRQLQERGWDV